MMASSPSFGFTEHWKRKKLLRLRTRSQNVGLNIMMLKGPRTLPRPSATASKIAFGEVEALTRRFVDFLAREGVRHGDRISLLSDNGIEPLVVFWGALRAGVIVNPINVEIREKHVSRILHDVAPKAVFWSRELASDPRALGTGGAPWFAFGTWNAPAPDADDLFARLRSASDAPVAARPARN